MKAKHRQKAAQAVLMILQNEPDMDWVGVGRVLHQMDWEAYRKNGKQVTRFKYRKYPEFGILPKQEQLQEVIEYLQVHGYVHEQ